MRLILSLEVVKNKYVDQKYRLTCNFVVCIYLNWFSNYVAHLFLIHVNCSVCFETMPHISLQVEEQDWLLLWGLIVYHGGRCQGNLTAQCTHLITAALEGVGRWILDVYHLFLVKFLKTLLILVISLLHAIYIYGNGHTKISKCTSAIDLYM